MDTGTRAEELMGFLRSMYGNRKVSLARATITDRGKSTQTFHEGAGRLKPWSMSIEAHAHNMIKKSDAGTEIFYSPVPMSGTKGRKKEQALPNVVVFGDADEGLTPDVHSRLTELGACLVRSGGNTASGPKYHVYLLLTREVAPEELERLNRGLKTFIRGDKFDSTTLLRLPGTRNHKYPGAPIVTVERYADAHHTPENLAKFLGVGDADPTHTGSALSTRKTELPSIPKGFTIRPRPEKPGYAKMRDTLRKWNQRFDSGDPGLRRYMATIALVKDAISRGLSVDEAYGFASECRALQDKAEEENGYSIAVDVARTWRRETFSKPSGTLTADDIVSAPQNDAGRNKTTTASPVSAAPPADLTTFSNGLELSEDFGFTLPNLDELLAGEYKPLEPTMVPCGTFHLLYPGKSHSLVADRGIGKTHIAIAMVHSIMKRGGKVAYFDFEDTPDTFIRDRMMNQHGISAKMIKTQFLYVGGSSADLGAMEAEDSVQYLASKLGDAKWDLVIIDGVSASMGDLDDDWDDNKAVDYKKWHALMVQPFLDNSLATLQLDHSTKSAPRAGGTMQKGAKLTGVEYQVRVHGPNSFTIGRTGQVIIEAVKDRVGRISKHRRSTPPTDHAGKDEWPWNDIATFTLTSDDEGRITQARFEPVNLRERHTEQEQGPPPLSDRDHETIKLLTDHGQPITKYALKKLMGGNGSAAQKIIDSLIERGHIALDESKKVVPVQVQETGTILDFSRMEERRNKSGDYRPHMGEGKLECRNCGDMVWTGLMVQPDEIGYRPDHRRCRDCASENIASEPVDGPEWARKKREDIERNNSSRGRRRRS